MWHLLFLLPLFIQQDYPLVYSQDFTDIKSRADLPEMSFADPNSWRVVSSSLEVFQDGEYQPEVRSPMNYAVINNVELGNFVMELQVKQTGHEYGHRDMCLIFGFQDPSHFYYTHIASVADETAHNVFIVDGKPRASIGTKTTKGVAWGEEWHTLRLVRNIDSGVIAVYFDDMDTPIMEAVDRSFKRGYVGFGSFDDTGMISQVKIWGDRRSATPIQPFKKP